MKKETRIAVDAMGGDGGPEVIMPSLKDFLLYNSDVYLNVFGNENIISPYLNIFDNNLIKQIKIIHTE